MAVFLVNICKFQGCGLKCATLRDLIHHVEDIHIVTDPKSLEEQEISQPSSLPLSYVLRFSKNEKEKRKKPPRLSSVSPVPSLKSSTTESEVEDEDGRSDADSTDDLWTNLGCTSEISPRIMDSEKVFDLDKLLLCPIPGCEKKYKTVNGLKYHAKNRHKNDLRLKQPGRHKLEKKYQLVCSGNSLASNKEHILKANIANISSYMTVSSNSFNNFTINNLLPVSTSSTATQSKKSTLLKETDPSTNSVSNSPQMLVKTTFHKNSPPIVDTNIMNNTALVQASSSVPISSPSSSKHLPPGAFAFTIPPERVKLAVPISQVFSIQSENFTIEKPSRKASELK